MTMSFRRMHASTVLAFVLLLAFISVSVALCSYDYPINCGDGYCCPAGRTCGQPDTCGLDNCCGSSSSSYGGAIAGGVVGGLCFVSILAFVIRRWFCVAAAVGVGVVIGASSGPRVVPSQQMVVVQQSPAPVAMVGAPGQVVTGPMYPNSYPQPMFHQPVAYGAPPPGYAPNYNNEPGYAMPAQPPPYSQAPPPNYVPAY